LSSFNLFKNRSETKSLKMSSLRPKTLKLETLKHHWALIPLAGALGFGLCLSAFYTARLAIQNPDVSWRRTSNPEPWQHRVDEEGNTVRYKFYQGPEGDRRGQTTYGAKAHPDERPPIEKFWAEYKAENKKEAHH